MNAKFIKTTRNTSFPEEKSDNPDKQGGGGAPLINANERDPNSGEIRTGGLEQLSDQAVYESFDEMNLRDTLLRGVYAEGFETPSYIQQKGTMPIINGRDTIGQAKSGTGKTGAFAIGCLQRIDESDPSIQILLLAPTRILARQIYNVQMALAQYMNVASYLCVGGSRVRNDIEAIRAGCQVIVGTPGRVNDLLSRGALDLSRLSTFVLDEADEMLSRGFMPQMKEIFTYLPQQVQVCLFSATMPPEVLKLTNSIMRNPAKILLKEEDVPLEGIRQYFVDCERQQWKFDVLGDLYETLNIAQAMIFVNSRERAERLQERMEQMDFSTSVIHGGLEEDYKREVMKAFRQGTSRVLIATNMLARGIDVAAVSLVINFDVPTGWDAAENYIQRIGRCSRFGKKGVAINFVVGEQDKKQLGRIQAHWGTSIEEMPQDVEL